MFARAGAPAALAALFVLAAPGSAFGIGLNPVSGLGLDPGSIAKSVVGKVIDALFGSIPGSLGDQALKVMLTYPDLSDGGQFGHLHAASVQTEPIAGCLLALCALLGFVHGLAHDGAGGGLQAGKRLVGSVIGIVAWPWLFAQAVAGANFVFVALLDTPVVRDGVGRGLSVALVAGFTPLGLFVRPVATVLFLVLLATKIAAVALLSLSFIAGPFACAVYPFPPLSHLAGACFQTLGAILLLPVIWALIVVVFAATGAGALSLDGGGMADAVTGPLVALTMLAMLIIALPFLLRRAHAAGMLPTLRGAAMAAGAAGRAGRLGAAVLGERAGARMSEHAAPPTRGGAGPDGRMTSVALPVHFMPETHAGSAPPTGSDGAARGGGASRSAGGGASSGVETRPGREGGGDESAAGSGMRAGSAASASSQPSPTSATSSATTGSGNASPAATAGGTTGPPLSTTSGKEPGTAVEGPPPRGAVSRPSAAGEPVDGSVPTSNDPRGAVRKEQSPAIDAATPSVALGDAQPVTREPTVILRRDTASGGPTGVLGDADPGPPPPVEAVRDEEQSE